MSRTARSRPNLAGIVTALLGLALSALWCYGALSFEIRVDQPGIGPRSWPLIVGAAAILISLALLVHALLGRGRRRAENPATGWGASRVALTVGATAAALVAWRFGLSYLVWLPLLSLLLLFAYGGRGWRSLLITPCLITLTVYVLFDLLLKVPL